MRRDLGLPPLPVTPSPAVVFTVSRKSGDQPTEVAFLPADLCEHVNTLLALGHTLKITIEDTET